MIKKFLFTVFFSTILTLSAQAATITGTVKYDGEAPKLRPIKMDADPICLTHHEGAVYPQVLELGEGGTMGDVFVYAASGVPQKNYPAPADPVVVSQEGCMYHPHVFGVMVGQPVKILNPDGTLHNVHAMAKVNEEFNLAMPKFRKEVTKTFDKPEMFIPFKCDVHPWMQAYMSVMTNPYFDHTEKEDGKYTIANLPAGTYEIEAWHEKLPAQKATVTVAEGETKEVNFTFSRPSKE